MSTARLSRDKKRQLGQFLTPEATARELVRIVPLSLTTRVLEPSFGEGVFIFQLLDRLASTFTRQELINWSETHLYGCEIDHEAFGRFRATWRSRGWDDVPVGMEQTDFFRWLPPGCDRTAAIHRSRYFASPLQYFDLIIGNPPFGGSINPNIQDQLDAIFGRRSQKKIKKETYAFFIVKCIDLLKPGGKLVFICSDTLLTIATMTGLRNWLHNMCDVHISELPGSFSDTKQTMLVLTLTKRERRSSHITVFGAPLSVAEIETTPNLSWRVSGELSKYFSGVSLGDKMIATSGMTIGKNELFLRPIMDGKIEEPYTFEFGERDITVKGELARARLGKLSRQKLQKTRELESCGVTDKVIMWEKRKKPKAITLPHPDYCYYNKAVSQIVYSTPASSIFWRGDGEYVYTFKKTGNWYLRGVGGKKYFGKEGITWALIAPRLYPRYLPEGFILDSGAPCAFLRNGVDHDELYFILGWMLTDLCNKILKEVLNHTRNIQSKDFERLPYPIWVSDATKQQAVRAVKDLVRRGVRGQLFDFESVQVRALNSIYECPPEWTNGTAGGKLLVRQTTLF